ncbi:uncharacterized protein LOC110448450 [Mizuhopecten yessoensis]|uniref:uncharacterized protein LOC110448450 n=1 Tax=Mizuhopecten yessoensis TaxID=6573 RepID=UPI000B457488|nr:uncharacterized protein LOC110448450 [Mizuhopecten yessoensis]
MINSIPDYDTKNAIRQGIYISIEIGNVVHHIQIERGTSVLYLSAYSDPRIFEKLQKNYRKSNAAIENLKVWPVYSKEDPEYFKSKNAYFSRIQEYRQLVVANNVTRKEVIKFYSDIIASIIRCLAKCASLSMSGELWRTMVAYHMLLLATDAVGVERALGSSFYAEGNTSQTDLAWYIKMNMAANTYLNICSQYSKPMAKLLSDRLSESKLGGLLDGRRWQIISNISTVLHTPSAVLALKWFDNRTVFVDILQGIQDTSGKGILADLETDLDEISTKHNFSIVLVVGAIILYPTILMVVFKLTKQIQAVAVSMKVSLKDICLTVGKH